MSRALRLGACLGVSLILTGPLAAAEGGLTSDSPKGRLLAPLERMPGKVAIPNTGRNGEQPAADQTSQVAQLNFRFGGWGVPSVPRFGAPGRGSFSWRDGRGGDWRDGFGAGQRRCSFGRGQSFAGFGRGPAWGGIGRFGFDSRGRGPAWGGIGRFGFDSRGRGPAWGGYASGSGPRGWDFRGYSDWRGYDELFRRLFDRRDDMFRRPAPPPPPPPRTADLERRLDNLLREIDDLRRALRR